MCIVFFFKKGVVEEREFFSMILLIFLKCIFFVKSQISLSTFAPIKAFIEKRDVGDPDPIYISYPDSIFGLY